MSQKIAIETSDNCSGSVKWMPRMSAAELQKKLKEMGFTKYGRFSRCVLTYDGTVHGHFVPIESLTESDIDWVVGEDNRSVRSLLCAAER